MSSSAPVPTALRSEGETLVIAWNDGVTHRIRWSDLRKACPCASCKAEREQPQPLLPVLTASQAEPLRPTGMRPLGNYAYGISFSDGHTTGIYTFEYLRELGEYFAPQ